jgi:hypothetical protein
VAQPINTMKLKQKESTKTQHKINNNNYDLSEVTMTGIQHNGPPY